MADAFSSTSLNTVRALKRYGAQSARAGPALTHS